MTDPAATLTNFRRYAGLISPMLTVPEPFEAVRESADAVQVERGTLFPLFLLNPQTASSERFERLIELARSSRLGELAVVDRGGHQRPAYRGLLIYCCLQAYRIAYETLPQLQFGRWEEALRTYCDLLESDLGAIPLSDHSAPAAHGALICEAAWAALALQVAGKVFIRDAWTDLASATFGTIARAQTATGALLAATASDNPETHWYHELVLLHAAASYAVQAEDRTVAAAVRSAAEFHQAETQPDHATEHPYALFAFIWNESTRPLADQLLHAVSLRGGNLDAVSLILLEDALYCLELFL